MKLIVDCGNTNTSFGVFDDSKLLTRFDFKTTTSITTFELLLKIKDSLNFYNINLTDIHLVKVATVVKDMEALFLDLAKYIQIEVKVLQNDDIKIIKNIHNPETVGIDRLLNVYYAGFISKESNILVIDFGTATTFDFGSNGKFEGGIICAGIKTMVASLISNTSKISGFDFTKPESIIGKNTNSAISNGIYFGYSHLVNGIVKDFTDTHKDIKIFITGGMGSLLKDKFNFTYTINNDLTLEAILKA